LLFQFVNTLREDGIEGCGPAPAR